MRYKRSVLGFLWSLLNPLLMMGVFTLVFTLAFKVPIEDFPIFFLVGYLPWSFFQASATISMGVIVANANLVQKVYFPRELLPLGVVLSQFVHFALAMLVLFVALAVAGYGFLPYLPIFLLATVVLLVFTVGISMIFAAANTVFRDIQEFSTVLFLLWFYLTPVIYDLSLLPERVRWAIGLNPMTRVVELFRLALYDLAYPDFTAVASAVGVAVAAFVVGYALFGRLAADFAKEI